MKLSCSIYCCIVVFVVFLRGFNAACTAGQVQESAMWAWFFHFETFQSSIATSIASIFPESVFWFGRYCISTWIKCNFSLSVIALIVVIQFRNFSCWFREFNEIRSVVCKLFSSHRFPIELWLIDMLLLMCDNEMSRLKHTYRKRRREKKTSLFHYYSASFGSNVCWSGSICILFICFYRNVNECMIPMRIFLNKLVISFGILKQSQLLYIFIHA